MYIYVCVYLYLSIKLFKAKIIATYWAIYNIHRSEIYDSNSTKARKGETRMPLQGSDIMYEVRLEGKL